MSRFVGEIRKHTEPNSPEFELSFYGETVEKYINNLPEHLLVKVDRYVIMPNHVHLMLIIPNNEAVRSFREEVRAIRESPLRSRSLLSKAVGYIKMNASKEIRQQRGKTTVWQRGYHDHAVRDEDEYMQILEYIHNNPIRWKYDCFYTKHC